MYVRELKPGLLIRPVEHYAWGVDKLLPHKHNTYEESGIKELIESGIHHHATPRFVAPMYRRLEEADRAIAVYIGVKKLNSHYYGVKKQHMVLINGTIAVIDGYQFREIEKV